MESNSNLNSNSKSKRIRKIWVRDFGPYKGYHELVIPDVNTLVFLSGLNSSGKSVFFLVLAILACNVRENDQPKFIHYGTNGYEIGVETCDNISIMQKRTIVGKKRKSSKSVKTRVDEKLAYETQVVWEVKDLTTGSILYTNVKNGKVVALGKDIDVPDDTDFSIKQYFNFVKAEGEILNYRTRFSSNNLLFLQTGGGDNYKLLNQALHFDTLHNAQRLATEAHNVCSAEFKRLSEKKKIKAEELASMNVVPSDVLSDYCSKIDILRESIAREEKMESLVQKYTVLKEKGELLKIQKAVEVPEEIIDRSTKVSAFCSSYQNLAERQKELKKSVVLVPDECIARYSAINKLISDTEKLSKLKKEMKPDAVEVSDAIVTRYAAVSNLSQQKEKCLTLYSDLKKIDAENAEMQSVLGAFSDVLNELGFNFCPACGFVGDFSIEHTHTASE